MSALLSCMPGSGGGISLSPTTSSQGFNVGEDEREPPTSASRSTRLPLRQTLDIKSYDRPPAHHVLAPAPGATWASYLPHWSASVESTSDSSSRRSSMTSLRLGPNREGRSASPAPSSASAAKESSSVRTGFKNPWPSWHKPTIGQVWAGLEWGAAASVRLEGDDDLLAAAGTDKEGEEPGTENGRCQSPVEYEDESVALPKAPPASKSKSGKPSIGRRASSMVPALPSMPWQTLRSGSKAASVKADPDLELKVTEPNFALPAAADKSSSVGATWMGHAGLLLQLPALGSAREEGQDDMIRLLFDPIFSYRCSPSQLVGPQRSYASPCTPAALPPIDVVLISHSHYDHLDADSIAALWQLNSAHIRFVVPLGNKSWFTGAPLNVPEERVCELDWWDEVKLGASDAAAGGEAAGPDAVREDEDHLRIICTPAQHGSGRFGVDAGTTLWSSWFVERIGTAAVKSTEANDEASSPERNSFKVFFGGDTGLQFHGAGGPRASHASGKPSPYPRCPAFEEISLRLGAPDLLALPISVGATLSFLKSYDPLPASLSPFPRIDPGLTSANHMGAWDAVRVLNLMSGRIDDSPSTAQEASARDVKPRASTALAIHWGTFVSGLDEVTGSLRDLRDACQAQNVRFARVDGFSPTPAADRETEKSTFVAANHGESIWLPLD